MTAGGGYKKLFTGIDGFLIRTFGYTTARVWGFCTFYDWLNPDPRRLARPYEMVFAGLGGGFVAGVLTNPIDCVYARMQVDEMYPERYRRNYSSFYDGFIKTAQEGALMRGALANGLRIGAIAASMTSIFDWVKENAYYFFGPAWMTRFGATVAAVTVGATASLPFDMMRVRQ